MGMFDFFKKKRKSILINNTLTVTLINGNQLVFVNATKELYEFVSNKDITDEEVIRSYYEQLELQKEVEKEKRAENSEKNTIYKVIETKEKEKVIEAVKQVKIQKELIEIEEVKNKFPSLLATGDFEEEDGKVFMLSGGKRIDLSIPKIMVTKFISVIDDINKNVEDSLEEFIALKNFWMWASLCPNPQSREDLYGWINRNNLKINKNGFFFAYRKVVSVKNKECKTNTVNKALTEFISNAYIKVKAAKKGPKNFTIIKTENGEYLCVNINKAINTDLETVIGNLAELHDNVIVDSRIDDNTDAQTYTDDYTRKMDIRIGHEVSLEADKCDWDNTESCSNGLMCSPLSK